MQPPVGVHPRPAERLPLQPLSHSVGEQERGDLPDRAVGSGGPDVGQEEEQPQHEL